MKHAKTPPRTPLCHPRVDGMGGKPWLAGCLVLLTSLTMPGLTACRTPNIETTLEEQQPMEEPREDGPAWQAALLAEASVESREIALAEDVFAFDQIVFRADQAPVESEMMWLVMHSTLDWLARREQARGAVSYGYNALMAELEPGAQGMTGPLRVELTFLSSRHRQGGKVREALGVRLWREVDGRIPTLTLVMRRTDNQGAKHLIEEVLVWSHPDLEGGEGSALISSECLALTPGTKSAEELASGCFTPNMGEHAAAIGSIQTALEGIIWSNLSGTHYVETPLRERQEAQGSWEETLHPGLSAALGVRRREREIEEVDASTSFPPRVDIDAIFTDSSSMVK